MMHYMYRTKIVTPIDVHLLHSNMVEIIMRGIENPDVTIGELMDEVEA